MFQNIKGKNTQPKCFKTSPGKMKTKRIQSKKSPVSIYKKKAEIIYNSTTKVEKTVRMVQSVEHKAYKTYDKENFDRHDYTMDSNQDKCPFGSPSSLNLNFDTSEIFSNVKKTNILQETYDKSYNVTKSEANMPLNVLRPSNKQSCDSPSTDLFDNLTFTPLKSVAAAKVDKLDKGPRVIISVNSESDLDDSLDIKPSNKENQVHSIMTITSQQHNNWLTVNHEQIENYCVETPSIPNKKHPNTSSPKEMNSPNFSINTDFSRISDLSFNPQRYSTERKCIPKINESHELLNDKLSSDTYTKESPNTPREYTNHPHQALEKPPHYFNREQPKFRLSLFKEQRETYDKNYVNPWQNELRVDARSPPRSVTPPLQSIPEESAQFSHTQVFDKTDNQMATFTIDRTFDKTHDKSSNNTRQTWSKKNVRIEPDLWKVPVAYVRKSIKPKVVAKPDDSKDCKISNVTFESNKSIKQNITVNQIGNIYSQTATVDPFLSATYFYDEEAVHKFENEFKRWLNCILTPPADLDSNVEQKVDVGKAWIESRNKEVPLAPTKEQVCSTYHNSHRLESLRRSARNLLMGNDMAQVFMKVNAQIDKKLIAIRPDRNLHMDVGLQKLIMEILLSYNPLWLRIGLEAIYGIVLPLKSNSDIDGLTTFIIQRMFKNPRLKNKNSKSSAPNMLLPAYVEAIKKFTLKKFFMLVFFLDQAKQRKLISHDPCLFCRNAVCKESREIIIRYTRELIAGIGDITKHLRPLGYVVSHKQSYLEEYKYAVHNLALDIRDGVRLTKVMEIIMMKNGLLNQLRTPAISRLQKIHNVQVAMTALKEANFVIVGEITATDIADGHREKTLSLLWQIIHVFRAPLFVKAANVIQTWWRKKYQVIVEKRQEEERIRLRLTNAASMIQHWWRTIQYNRQVEWRMQQVTTATIVVQKYCRMWLCRTRLRRLKTSVLKIEEWFRSVKLMREAKSTLTKLRVQREQLKNKCATAIQSYVRRWLCVKRYKISVQRIVQVQSLVRRCLVKKQYCKLKKSVSYVQEVYRGKLLMRSEMQKFAEHRRSAVIIQSTYRMIKQRRVFLKLKKSAQTIEDCYIALKKMRSERNNYLELQKAVIAVQSMHRRNRCRAKYLKQRRSIILLQRRVRGHQLMKKDRHKFLEMKNAAIVLQTYVRSYLTMKKVREVYIAQQQSAILIQRYFRSYLLAKAQRKQYIQLRNASVALQKHYRCLRLMRKERKDYTELRNAALRMQRQYRAQIAMREDKKRFCLLKNATISIQRRYRAIIEMRKERSMYLKLKSSCIKIQHAYIAYRIGKQQRESYIKHKKAAVKIQKWFRDCKKGEKIKQEFQQSKQACVTIQRYYKAYIVGRQVRQEYVRIKTATICIQRFFRSYIEMKTIRREYIRIKTSTVTIQKFYRSYLVTNKQRKTYLRMKSAVSCIENSYRQYKEYQIVRKSYLQLREATITVQRRYRSITVMRQQRNEYLKLKHSAVTLQQKYRAIISMRVERELYIKLRSTVVTVQTLYRAQRLMKQERLKYVETLNACISIQRYFRAYILGFKERQAYLEQKKSAIVLQTRYRALLAMRNDRRSYLAKKTASITIQRKLRANNLMLKHRQEYVKTLEACKTIQSYFRAHVAGKKQRAEYLRIKTYVVVIQTRFRMLIKMRRVRSQYLLLRSTIIMIQRRFREKQLALSIKLNEAATKIQAWYRSVQKRDVCRKEFLVFRKHVIVVQSIVKMHLIRKRFLEIRTATTTIQQYYRSYKLTTQERQRYLRLKDSVIKLQSYVRTHISRKRYLSLRAAVITIQVAYKLKRQRELEIKRRVNAAVILQKHVRRYLMQSKYRLWRQKALYIQEIWRGKLLTRLIRCDYLQKKRIVINIQSAARGYLVRKEMRLKKEHILKIREHQRQNWAALKILVRILYFNFLVNFN